VLPCGPLTPPGPRLQMTTDKTNYHHGDLRAALIDAATDTIEELGPPGLTIREVAKRAGVSHAAPYRHFAGKDELILAVVERGFALLQDTMKQARDSAGEGAVEQFAASGEAYFSFARQYPTYYRVMFSGDLLSGTGDETLRHTSTSAFLDIKSYLRDCQDLELVRKDDELLQAIAIISSIHGFVSLVNDNRIGMLVEDKYSIEEVREFLIKSIFEGIG
jgi:AcrR family transcriptional regulator